MKIVHSVHILPDAVRLDGVALPVEGQGAELLSALYRAYVKDYPKFFKMDLLSKLGVIATELLVKDEPGRFTPREDRAVLLLSHSGPLCDDCNYQKTISGDDYFPSPALFVYTLANIVTGEIAIRNKYEGDTTAYGLEAFDPAQLVAVVCCQLLQGGKHIGHHYAAVVHFVVRVADYAKGSPLLQGLWGKGVAVEGLPLESKEEAAGGDGAREAALADVFDNINGLGDNPCCFACKFTQIS